MDYFQISESADPAISVSAGFDKNMQAILQERFKDIEDMCMYRIQIPNSVCLPDVLFRPVFMLSEPCWECVRCFEPYMEAGRCFLYNTDFSGVFYIPFLDTFESISNKRVLFNRHMFRLQGRNKKQIVISLELSESLLRRNFMGYSMKEL